VQKAQEKIIQMSREVLQNSRKQLTNEVNFLKAHLKLQLQSYRNVLDLSKQNLKGLSLEFLSNQRTTINTVLQPNLIRSAKMSLKNSLILIEGQEKVVNLLNPLNLLKRGYSLTFVDGKILKSVENIQKGQRIQTQFVDGIVDSEVIVVEKK
jgi:exodeoxyribonuclease VII large subunit